MKIKLIYCMYVLIWLIAVEVLIFEVFIFEVLSNDILITSSLSRLFMLIISIFIMRQIIIGKIELLNPLLFFVTWLPFIVIISYGVYINEPQSWLTYAYFFTTLLLILPFIFFCILPFILAEIAHLIVPEISSNSFLGSDIFNYIILILINIIMSIQWYYMNRWFLAYSEKYKSKSNVSKEGSNTMKHHKEGLDWHS